MTETTDGALVAQVLAGHHNAFGTLVNRYQDQMLAYVRYMGFGEAEACDLVQDSFVRAFRHLGRCGDRDRFAGWLFKIVSNLCRTVGSTNARRRSEPLDPHGRTLVSELPGPDEQMEANWTRDRVRTALDTVPPDQREALVLQTWHGWSLADIGRHMDRTPAAVAGLLKRGLHQLRDLLQESE